MTMMTTMMRRASCAALMLTLPLLTTGAGTAANLPDWLVEDVDPDQPWYETLLDVEHLSFDVHESGGHGVVRVKYTDEAGRSRDVEKKVHRIKDLYAPDAVVTDSDGALAMHEHNDALYTFHAVERGEAVVVNRDADVEGRVTVSLIRRGLEGASLLEFKHHSEIVHEMGETRFRNLRQNCDKDAYFGLVHDLHDTPRGREQVDEDEVLDSDDDDGRGGSRRSLFEEEDRFAPPQQPNQQSAARTLASAFELRDINLDPYRDELAFFPFCYPFDTRRQVIDIGLATSRATWENEQKSVTRIQSKYEDIVAKVNVIMQAQLNFALRIRRMMIAANNVPNSWHEIFHFSKEKGTCPDPPKGIRLAMFTFAPSLSMEDNVGSWTFIHGCPSDGNGFGQSGSLCRLPKKGGSCCQSKTLSFRVVSHEMGHTIGGMEHTFQNGQRNTGGLMDYGGGRIRGTKRYAYSLLTREKSCYRTNNAFDRIPECPYWRNASGALACGDRFLLPEEECECEDGSTSCAGCENCKLKDTSRECSTGVFFMHPQGATGPIVEGGSFSSPECCTSGGDLASVTDTCTMPDGETGRCSLGRCVNPCATFGMAMCGVENSGCLQKCKPSGGQCAADFYKRKADRYAGELDDGSKCVRGNGGDGQCRHGECVPTSAPLDVPRDPLEGQMRTLPPVPRPTPYPTTPHPTLFPTNPPTDPPVPTARPTKAPTTPRPTRAPPTPRPTKQPTKPPTPAPTTRCDATCDERQGTGSRSTRKKRCLDEDVQGKSCTCVFVKKQCRDAASL